MIGAEGTPFDSEILDELDLRALTIHEPTYQDAVQVAPKGEITGTMVLDMHIDAGVISVVRRGGEPIQAELNTLAPIDGSVLQRIVRTRVFAHPVHELVLVRGMRKGEWTATGDDVEVISTEALAEFAHSLAEQVLAKQWSASELELGA